MLAAGIPSPVLVLVLPHLHVVHHHLIGQVASVLCLVHLLVQQGLWGRIRVWECWGWADTLQHPKAHPGTTAHLCAH